MKALLSKCGFDCGRCAAYKENVKTKKDRQRGNEAWKKYYGFRLSVSRMYCDGCQASDKEKLVLLGRGCTIRKCALIQDVETCAHCSEFHTCTHTLKIFGHEVDRKNIEDRLGISIPEGDYRAYIEPYENLKHLDKVRRSLKASDIKKANMYTREIKTVDFPAKLTYTKREISAFKKLYTMLAHILSLSGNTYAQHVALKKRKEYFLKLLWTFGLYGALKRQGKPHLIVDSNVYIQQKLIGNLQTVLMYIGILKKFGVMCEHVPLSKERYGKDGWLTPMGWLRRTGWYMKMSFSDNVGGVLGLKALQKYTARLNKQYGKKAFSYFEKADMRVLTQKKKSYGVKSR
jgi:hypothetical protein